MTTTPTRIQPYGLADLDLLPPGAVAALLGDAVHLATELSPITHVDASTAPTFVWATAQDGPGLPNALAWTRALAEHARVPALRGHVRPPRRVRDHQLVPDARGLREDAGTHAGTASVVALADAAFDASSYAVAPHGRHPSIDRRRRRSSK